MVDRVASNDSSCFNEVPRCFVRGAREHRSCRLFLFFVSFCVTRVANFEHEAQVRSHLVSGASVK